MADMVYAPFDDQRAPSAAAAAQAQGFFGQPAQPSPVGAGQDDTPPSGPHGSDNGANDDDDSGRGGDNKQDVKPQATFLTKLYALLEKPENQHMIRWDANGDHIIVERPEQLALHVLPSVYRQSRFASFSRQLNIYGFMRKVNLRNVDPSIDDPDASTWSHPTLNRHSSPDVVANFKRRVPPRLPKAKKRADAAAAAAAAAVGGVHDLGALNVPRSAGGPLTPAPLVPSSVPPFKTRNRAFTAPGSYVPSHHQHQQHNTSNPPGQHWTHGSYGRNGVMPLPPLNLPDQHANSMYAHSHMAPHSAAEETPTAFAYGAPANLPPRDHNPMYNLPNSYPYQQPSTNDQNWAYQPHVTNSPNSISSLLNPTVPSHSAGAYHQGRPTPISTHLSPVQPSYPSPFSSVPLHGTPSGSSMSPDSRPTTGYSNYDDGASMGCSRPNTGNRPVTPGSVGRPGSSHDTLSIRRGRRHSQAVNPYPSPYEMEHRPGTAPSLTDVHPGMHRAKSLIQLPSVESYCYNQADFAYTPNGPAMGNTPGTDSSMDGSWMSGARGADLHGSDMRPSTAHSQISVQSHSSANTPPTEQPYHDAEMQRFSPDFGFLAMKDNTSPSVGMVDYVKAANDC